MLAPVGRISVVALCVSVSAPSKISQAARPALSAAKSMSVIVVVPVTWK